MCGESIEKWLDVSARPANASLDRRRISPQRQRRIARGNLFHAISATTRCHWPRDLLNIDGERSRVRMPVFYQPRAVLPVARKLIEKRGDRGWVGAVKHAGI